MTDPTRLRSEGDASERALLESLHADAPDTDATAAMWKQIATQVAIAGAATSASAGTGASVAPAKVSPAAKLSAALVPKAVAAKVAVVVAVGALGGSAALLQRSEPARESASPRVQPAGARPLRFASETCAEGEVTSGCSVPGAPSELAPSSESERGESGLAEAEAHALDTRERANEARRPGEARRLSPRGHAAEAREHTAPLATRDDGTTTREHAGEAGPPSPRRTNEARALPTRENGGDTNEARERPSEARERGDQARAASLQARPALSALRAESRMLATARARLRAGDLAGAEDTLNQAREQFREGALGQEREVLQIELLAALGDRDGADHRARRFLRKHPDSPHAKSVQRFLLAP